MRALLIVLALGIGVGAPRLSAAQGDLREQARRLVTEGQAAQDGGRYDEAIALYERAYALVPHPELLYNLAQAHRLKGDLDPALAHYRRYLAIDPKGRVSADARRRVTEIEKAIADRKAEAERVAAEEAVRAAAERAAAQKARADAEEAARARAAQEQAARAQAEQVKAESEAAALARSNDSESRTSDAGERSASVEGRSSSGKRIAGMASGGAGVVLISAGIYFGHHARSISNELSEHDGPWTDALLARQDEATRSETTMFVCVGLGAAAAITGGVLYYLGRDGSSDSVAIVPTHVGDANGLVVMWRR
jgi:tetratricopeptide (TPR) repeat protein